MIIGICDDMKASVLELQTMLEHYFNEKNLKPEIKPFFSGKALLECSDEIDILFLDIELGDCNALDLLKDYRSKYRNTLLIIVTSYGQYLDDAMDLDVLRYIDKPVKKERIFNALDKAAEILDNMYIYVNDNKSNVYHINKQDIVYVESILRQVHIHTKNKTITTNTTLKELRHKLLSTSYLASPHYSYIINLNYLKLYSRKKVVIQAIDNEKEIPVSSRYQADFRKVYLNFMRDGYGNV